MKLKGILESYYLSINKDKGHVYENPTRVEMMKAAEEDLTLKQMLKTLRIRFFADPKEKKLYVWNSEYIHWRVLKFLGKSAAEGLCGLAMFVNNKWKYDYHVVDRDYLKKVKSKDFKWLDRYIITSPIIKDNLNESYYSSLSKNEFHVYENPTRVEMMKASKEDEYKDIRFYINNKNKKLYVWSANIPHFIFFHKHPEFNKFNEVYGVASFKDNKWIINKIDLVPKMVKKLLTKEYKWIDRYFHINKEGLKELL